MKTDGPRFNTLFHGLLDRGVYIAPALYEAGFVSAAHSEADIAKQSAAARYSASEGSSSGTRTARNDVQRSPLMKRRVSRPFSSFKPIWNAKRLK